MKETLAKICNSFKSKNIKVGYMYFYVHLCTEVACFYALNTVTGNPYILWLSPFVYDCLAFVLQAPIGYFCDKFKKFKPGMLGAVLLLAGLLLKLVITKGYIPIIVISLGNAFVHVAGAKSTLGVSEGKLSHSAIFVAGGSFGVVMGKIFAKMHIPLWTIILVTVSMIPYIIFVDKIKLSDNLKEFNFANPKRKPMTVIFVAVLIVIIRGYMGYAVPTSWNKTTLQTVLLFSFMGVGKAMGGILSDAIGIRKTLTISMLLGSCFLLFGDSHMIVSLVGVMMFSMTMPITLGLLVSKLKRCSGLAFGLTTIGLWLGTMPIFFFRIVGLWPNLWVIIIATIVGYVPAMMISGKEAKEHDTSCIQ